jgi:hypothetical protein
MMDLCLYLRIGVKPVAHLKIGGPVISEALP